MMDSYFFIHDRETDTLEQVSRDRFHELRRSKSEAVMYYYHCRLIAEDGDYLGNESYHCLSLQGQYTYYQCYLLRKRMIEHASRYQDVPLPHMASRSRSDSKEHCYT